MKTKLLFAVLLFGITKLALSDVAKAELPVNFSQGLPSTYIYIENKKIPLLVDSGASKYSIVLSKLALKSLKVKYTGTQSCSNTINGRICMKEFTIPTVTVGNIVLHNVAGAELQHLWGNDKGFIETEASKNGLIGLAFLKNFNMLLDYKNHRIILTKLKTYPENLNIKNCSRAKFEFDKGILTNFLINNKRAELIIDTGSNLSYIKSSKINQNSLPCNDKYAKEFDNCHYTVIKLSNDFNNYMASEKFYVSEMNVPFDGILGGTFIQNHLLFMDSYNRLIYVC